ncbi:hypothetical protein FQZ97_855170 [compost metagenome]
MGYKAREGGNLVGKQEPLHVPAQLVQCPLSFADNGLLIVQIGEQGVQQRLLLDHLGQPARVGWDGLAHLGLGLRQVAQVRNHGAQSLGLGGGLWHAELLALQLQELQVGLVSLGGVQVILGAVGVVVNQYVDQDGVAQGTELLDVLSARRVGLRAADRADE